MDGTSSTPDPLERVFYDAIRRLAIVQKVEVDPAAHRVNVRLGLGTRIQAWCEKDRIRTSTRMLGLQAWIPIVALDAVAILAVILLIRMYGHQRLAQACAVALVGWAVLLGKHGTSILLVRERLINMARHEWLGYKPG
jgi:hypothetical protein